MNEYSQRALYHAWSKTPQGKQNEHDYNVNYYQEHRNKIIQNVLERRKKRKESGMSTFDYIVTSLDKAYSDRLAKNRTSGNPSLIGKIDYRLGGEKVYDIVHTIAEAGRWIMNRYAKTLVGETKNTYKEGFKWLKEHW